MKIVFFKFHSNSKGFFPRGVLKTQKRLETHHLLQKMLPISPEIRAGFKRSGVRWDLNIDMFWESKKKKKKKKVMEGRFVC